MTDGAPASGSQPDESTGFSVGEIALLATLESTPSTAVAIDELVLGPELLTEAVARSGASSLVSRGMYRSAGGNEWVASGDAAPVAYALAHARRWVVATFFKSEPPHDALYLFVTDEFTLMLTPRGMLTFRAAARDASQSVTASLLEIVAGELDAGESVTVALAFRATLEDAVRTIFVRCPRESDGSAFEVSDGVAVQGHEFDAAELLTDSELEARFAEALALDDRSLDERREEQARHILAEAAEARAAADSAQGQAATDGEHA